MLNRLPPFPTVAIGISAIIIAVVAIRENWQTGLIAVAVLLVGLWGSYVLGRESRNAPPVRQAYRHLARIQANLYALTERLAADRDALSRYEGQDQAHAGLRKASDTLSWAEFAIGQTWGYVGEAMEDWAELAPEEVEELRQVLSDAAPNVADDDTATVEAGEWFEITPPEEE